MVERYIIEELTPEDLERELERQPESKVTVKLVETGYKPTNMGFYETREAAEKSKTEWIARDKLQEKVSDFFDEMLEEFSGKLDDDEIREIIHGA